MESGKVGVLHSGEEEGRARPAGSAHGLLRDGRTVSERLAARSQLRQETDAEERAHRNGTPIT